MLPWRVFRSASVKQIFDSGRLSRSFSCSVRCSHRNEGAELNKDATNWVTSSHKPFPPGKAGSSPLVHFAPPSVPPPPELQAIANPSLFKLPDSFSIRVVPEIITQDEHEVILQVT